MARVKLEAGAGIAGLSGRVGNLVFRRGADGQTYVQQAPAGKMRPGSVAQQACRGGFREATVYGKGQQASSEGRAYYQPFVVPGRFGSVYRAALTDFLQPPQLLAVEAAGYRGQAGALLRVQAHKPCGITAVVVQVLDAAGQVLEEGAALAGPDNWWQYRTTVAHPFGAVRQVQLTAEDRPGNIAKATLELE